MNNTTNSDHNDLRGQVLSPADLAAYAPGAVVSRTLLDHPAGTLTVFSFDVDQGLSEHTAPYDATVLVLDGEARITIGGEARGVKAGEMVIMPAGIPHALRADTRFKMLLIMIRQKVA